MLAEYNTIIQELRRLQTSDVKDAEKNLASMCIQPTTIKLFYKIIKDFNAQSKYFLTQTIQKEWHAYI